MTEDDARASLTERFGSRALAELERFVALILAENRVQNLIGRATESQIWVRHIVDAAQLLRFTDGRQHVLDVGSGPGLPGLVMAMLSDSHYLLVEPRKRRTDFLHAAASALNLKNVSIQTSTVQGVAEAQFDTVVARAYAALGDIFGSTYRLTDSSTLWVLPKGRSAEAELAEARKAWQGVFHVEQSLTSDDAKIIVATGVAPR